MLGTSLTTVEESNLDDNIKEVAYLCNTENWTDTYVSEADKEKGIWVIGAAPVEMFCASYNARIRPEVEFSAKAYSENSTTGYRFKPAVAANEDGYGYDSNISYPISTEYGGMYTHGSSDFPNLSSPSSKADYLTCIVHGYQIYLGWGMVSNPLHVRPIVSLPSDYEIQLQ